MATAETIPTSPIRLTLSNEEAIDLRTLLYHHVRFDSSDHLNAIRDALDGVVQPNREPFKGIIGSIEDYRHGNDL